MPAFSPPVSHADTEGTLGYAAVFAESQIMEELVERLNPQALGLLVGEGDLSGTGSDTLTISNVTGFGWHEEFTAMGSETAQIPLTGWTANNDTLTIARYGLAKSETFQRRILARQQVQLFLEQLIERVPDSLARTIMTQLCTAFQSVSGSSGTSGQAWTFDDELDMLAYFRETEGAGNIIAVRHAEQYTDLYESMRNEPAFQSPEVMSALLGLQNGDGAAAQPLFGVRNVSSFRVTQSGGDHIGCAYMAGSFMHGMASTESLAGLLPPSVEMVMPALGLYIGLETSGGQANSRFDANSWLGIAQRDADVTPARQMLSVDD